MQSDTSSGEPVMPVEVAGTGPVPPHEGGVNGGNLTVFGMDTTTTTTTSGELQERGMIRIIGDEGDKINSIGGNRWPRQETLALLKIRFDMDAVFRDSSLKGPLWEEVSRKLRELGYKRSAKKCKEKFENVYKYHKRTKDTRNAKPEGKTKTYRFFDQLQALESRSFIQSHPPQPQPQPPNYLATNTLTTLPFPTRPNDHLNFTTITAATTTSTTTVPSTANPNLFTTATASTSSATASDEDLEERYRKKRKWKEYFRRLTRRVLARQEEMQKRFLEAIDKRERERVAQQEAWRMQEMARINREHEILVQERSTAAAKDAAVIAFLQTLSVGTTPQPPPPPPPPPQPQLMIPNNCENFEIQKVINYNSNHNQNHNSNGGGGGGGSGGGRGGISSSSSRWPKAEVHALIRMRMSLEAKYQDNGPKGPLWEEISLGMQRLGYNRNAKRCKEKWENINKYFKKIKESNRQRREDSKTCPYFQELDALYFQKSQTQSSNINNFNFNLFGSIGHNVEPLMVQPEQQWRPPEGNAGHEDEKEEEDEENEEDGGSMELEEEEGGGGNEIDNNNNNNNGTNKLSSVDTVE